MYIFELCAAIWQDLNVCEKEELFPVLDTNLWSRWNSWIDVTFFTYQMFDFKFLVTIVPNFSESKNELFQCLKKIWQICAKRNFGPTELKGGWKSESIGGILYLPKKVPKTSHIFNIWFLWYEERVI